MSKPDSELLYYLGTAHYQLKQVEESRKALQSALSMNPDSKLAEEVRRLLTQMSVKR